MATLLEVSIPSDRPAVPLSSNWYHTNPFETNQSTLDFCLCSVFRRSNNQQISLQPHEDAASIDIEQNQAAESEAYGSRPSSSSNNILNQNLSGSFREPQSFGNRDGGAHTTTYAPSAPPTAPHWPTATQYQPLSTVPRLGVAAIPNQHFNQMHDVQIGDDEEATAGQSRRNQRPPAPSQQYFV